MIGHQQKGQAYGEFQIYAASRRDNNFYFAGLEVSDTFASRELRVDVVVSAHRVGVVRWRLIEPTMAAPNAMGVPVPVKGVADDAGKGIVDSSQPPTKEDSGSDEGAS